MSVLRQLGLFAGVARALPRYLDEPLHPAEARTRVIDDLGRRAANFLRVLDEGVYPVPESPYRRLLAHAGIGREDLAGMVGREEVEGALAILHAAGVYATLDEFKGRVPIRRGSLEIAAGARPFDNPLSATHIEAQSGGSRSAGTRLTIDLDHNARSAIYDRLLFEGLDALDRPLIIWQPTLPYGAGVNALLRCAKLRHPVERWYSQNVPPTLGTAWQHGLLTRFLVMAMRRRGLATPWPVHVPLDQADRIARDLAALARQGRPALVNTNASSGTRICLAARDLGLDIAGTLFRLGGEPLTEARAQVVAAAGARAVTIYGMGEIGRVGLPCGNPAAVDEVHVLTDKLAVLQLPRRRADGPPVPVNVYTTLTTSTPKLMLNVESDDYGDLHRRDCGCALHRLGLGLHLHTIRSHEKLTSEGMNFIGHDLLRLIEEVLPGRFGGGPTDYQLVEDEDERGLPKVELLVAPRLGPMREADLVDCMVGFLNGIQGNGLYGERWREARSLRVARREPHATAASKILALHTLRPKKELAATAGTTRRRG